VKVKKGVGPWYESYFGPDYLIIDEQPNTPDEVRFMVRTLGLRKGTRLLDAACGYGRHMIPLITRGVNVTGCDLSQFMIEESLRRMKKQNVRPSGLVRCDIRHLPFRRVFSAACIMFNSFGYFDAEDDNFLVLKGMAMALKPGGRFLLDLVNRDFVLRSMCKKDWFERNDTIVLERKWIDQYRNRSEIDVHVVDKRGKRTYHHSIRLYSFTEVSMLLEAAGFEIQDVFGGFNGEPFDRYHDRMLILARVAGRNSA